MRVKIHYLTGIWFFTLGLLISGYGEVADRDIDHLLRSGRQLFYDSVEDKTKIDSAIHLFQQLIRRDPAYEGRAMTYLGVLTALKGKHSFWPHQKLSLAQQGLALMDKGIAISPDDAEALFVHGCTCYYLPAFLRRGDDAQRDFKKILRLLPAQMNSYDAELIHNALKFIVENAELDANDRDYIRQIKLKLSHQ